MLDRPQICCNLHKSMKHTFVEWKRTSSTHLHFFIQLRQHDVEASYMHYTRLHACIALWRCPHIIISGSKCHWVEISNQLHMYLHNSSHDFKSKNNKRNHHASCTSQKTILNIVWEFLPWVFKLMGQGLIQYLVIHNLISTDNHQLI